MRRLTLYFSFFLSKVCHVQADYKTHGHSQNLKEVPQDFADVFNIDHVIANDIIHRNQQHKEKKQS